jgi:hypothetical protein
LGFLGRWPFGRENPRLQGLEKLGFPWILSSESSLFNGLRGIFRKRNFARPFALGGSGGRGDTAVEVMRMRRIIHEASLAQFLLFVNLPSSDSHPRWR